MAGENKQTSAPGEDADVSMEDILQSIRRIIADEDDPAAAQNGNGNNGSDVLELTDVMVEQPAPAKAAAPAKPAASEKPDDVLAKIDTMLAPAKPVEPASAPLAAPAPKKEMPMQPSGMDDDSLLSAQASQAVVNTINKLDEALEPPAPQITSPTFASGNTVEKMVMDMLRPMMKSWLDANLPVIVERIVEREVRKLIR